jgi:hypothetical protein
MSSPTPYVMISVELENGFLPRDMVSWLYSHVGGIVDATDSNLNIVGNGWDAWGLRATRGPSNVTFKFDDVRKATLFKLTWGGL